MPRRKAYKEVRLQQLRSFCETARLGSLAAAAVKLGVSQPAVWEQVHALEREFGVPLIEPFGRGCRVTELGRFLAERADPLVAGIDSLKRLVKEYQGEGNTLLTVAAPQRILVDDLPEVVGAFLKKQPNVRLRLLERRTHEVGETVEVGLADLGLDNNVHDAANPRLECQPAYELDILLLTPKGHPLSARRSIRLEDLRRYPLLNAIDDFSRPEIVERLRALGVFDTPSRRLEVNTTAVIRRYVEMGLGLGMVFGRRSQVPDPRLHVHSLSRFFGRGVISMNWRRGISLTAAAQAFTSTIRELRP